MKKPSLQSLHNRQAELSKVIDDLNCIIEGKIKDELSQIKALERQLLIIDDLIREVEK